jgi:hypothetical protein
VEGGERGRLEGFLPDDDDDVYLDKLQTRDVKKSLLYM